MTKTATAQISFSRQARKDRWFVTVDGVLNWTTVFKRYDAYRAGIITNVVCLDWVCVDHQTGTVLGYGSTREEAAQKGL